MLVRSYVNYYTREGERVAVGDLVYTIDETGRLQDYLLSTEMNETSLSDKELAEFRNDIVNFMHNFDEKNFSTTYDFKYNVKSTVLKLANSSIVDNLQTVNSHDLFSMVNLINNFRVTL